jgi:nitrogen regulatory protein P-II 1
MKLIKCVIPAAKLEAVKAALLDQGVQGLTVHDVRGFGIHRAQREQKVSRNYLVELRPQVMIELALSDDKVGAAVKAITTTARTGRLGDGKLFILPVEDAIRLRTGERGDPVL